MSGAEGDGERFGQVLRITALAATLVALAAVIGPRLAFSGGGGGIDPAAASLPVDATPVVNTTRPALPSAPTTSTVPATTTTTTSTPADTTTTTAPSTATTIPVPVVPVTPAADGGAVKLSLAGMHAGRYGPERVGFFAGETIGWHFRVTNTGEEYLWGVFVYLELSGPVACTSRRLAVGTSTDCWAETTALAPRSTAEAWVTAWTEVRMVSDRVSHRVVLTAD